MWSVEEKRNKEGKNYLKKENIWPVEEKKNRGGKYFKKENI